MKTPEEMMAYFKSMPKKEKINPYWGFVNGTVVGAIGGDAFTPSRADTALAAVRDYFRMVYRSFGTEAQALCMAVEDAPALLAHGIPMLGGSYRLGECDVAIFVPPQVNTPANSIISEWFWQEYIAGPGIVPVARIHSHHRLDAYQSPTDYATLNSGTLEIVMGHVLDEPFQVAFWLDEHGKGTKGYVFRATERSCQNLFFVEKIVSGNPDRYSDVATNM